MKDKYIFQQHATHHLNTAIGSFLFITYAWLLNNRNLAHADEP